MRKFFARLEYRYGKYAIENFMAYLCCTMGAVYILQYFIGVPVIRLLSLSRYALLKGQIWRAITFIAIPPAARPLSLLITLYFYYFLGSQLERTWGSFQLNCFYLSGMVLEVIACLLCGSGTNMFLNLSLFLAFAQLYPEMEVLLMFVLPIKVKYLAALDWILFVFYFLTGGLVIKLSILAAVINFLLFFGDTFRADFQSWMRRREWKNQNRF